MSKKLRFAALVRVSTEKQEKQGESLQTQRTSNKRDVESLGGTIAEWYGGQEHATPGGEKREVDRLLRDAQHKKFDAVIVAYADRWSRDNEKSKQGLRILRDNGVAFYVGRSEMDLHSPETRLFLGMSAEIGEFTAGQQNKKSIENRIARAKNGMPSAGKLPPGRTFDPTKPEGQRWGIKKDFQDRIKDIAKRYLAGASMADLAAEYGMNHANLHKTLNERCGDKWKLRFDSDDLNIHEAVTIKVPRLLPQSTIDAIRAKAKTNKTYDRKHASEHEYILSGRVFCSHCNYALTHQPPTKERKHHYYRHGSRDGAKDCEVTPRPYIRCDELDNAVLRTILATHGNPTALQRELEDAIPNKKEVDEARREIQLIDAAIKKVDNGRQAVIKMVLNGELSEVEAKPQLYQTKERLELLTAQRDRHQARIDNVATAEEAKAAAERASKYVTEKYASTRKMIKLQNLTDPRKLKFKQKLELIKEVLSGTRPDGKPMGVYVAVDGQKKKHKHWKYKLHGHPAIDAMYGKAGTELVYEEDGELYAVANSARR